MKQSKPITKLQFISASPTRSGWQVQARFRVYVVYPDKKVKKVGTRGWTLDNDEIQALSADPRLAARRLSNDLTLHGYCDYPKPKDVAAEALVALPAMRRAQASQADAQLRFRAAAGERLVRSGVLTALRAGITDARIRELTDETLVEYVMKQ